MKFYNQNDYLNPYPSRDNPRATIKSGGCGVCTSANVLLFFGLKYDPVVLSQIFIKEGARVNGGTDMSRAAQIVCRLGDLVCTKTNDEAVLAKHLSAGGIAIANVDGDVGEKGIFSSAGHYINVIGASGDKLTIFDVGFYSTKFNSAYRKALVILAEHDGNAIQICTQKTLNIDTKNRNPNYYLFSRKEKNMEKTTVAVGNQRVNAVLIDDKTFVELRPFIDAVKTGLAVEWSAEKGASVKI